MKTLLLLVCLVIIGIINYGLHDANHGYVKASAIPKIRAIQVIEQSVNVHIENRYAQVTYTHKFRNPSENDQEIEYQIELDPQAFVSHFSALLNNKTFIGQTKPAETAQKEYNDAVDSGLAAILVSQDHDASVFSIKCNLEGSKNDHDDDETSISIETDHDQNLNLAVLNITSEMFIPRRFGWYELSFVLNNLKKNAPHAYVRGNDEYDILCENTPITVNIYDEFGINDIDIPAPTNINYQNAIEYEYSIDNKNVLIKVNAFKELINDPTQFVFRFQTNTMLNNEQFLYDIIENSKNNNKDNKNKDEKKQTELVFLHTFSYENNIEKSIPRRMMIVLDRSGSMSSNNKWQNAVSATIEGIKRLNGETKHDRFGIVLFDHDVSSLPIVEATETNKKDIISWLKRFDSGGSTNIFAGVKKGIELIHKDEQQGSDDDGSGFVNQLVLITDGRCMSGNDDKTIKKLIFDANKKLSTPASIFTLGMLFCVVCIHINICAQCIYDVLEVFFCCINT